MNVKRVLKELKQKYPKKVILKNKDDKGMVSEILREVDPASLHSDYSLAVAVIDYSHLNVHRRTKETYRVIKGALKILRGF